MKIKGTEMGEDIGIRTGELPDYVQLEIETGHGTFEVYADVNGGLFVSPVNGDLVATFRGNLNGISLTTKPTQVLGVNESGEIEWVEAGQ